MDRHVADRGSCQVFPQRLRMRPFRGERARTSVGQEYLRTGWPADEARRGTPYRGSCGGRVARRGVCNSEKTAGPGEEGQ
jgi:hypothetical protein